VMAAITLAALAWTPAPASDVESGRRKAEACGACHGPDGNATIPGTPSLSAMTVFDTHWQLIMFRDGRRSNAQMAPFVEKLSDQDLSDLSAFYAAQRPTAPSRAVDPGLAATARPLAERYFCTSCHGLHLMGQQQVPRLAGQDLVYLLARLRGYKAKTTSDLDGMMTMVAQSLSDEEVETLSRYLAAVDPTAGQSAAQGAR